MFISAFSQLYLKHNKVSSAYDFFMVIKIFERSVQEVNSQNNSTKKMEQFSQKLFVVLR